MRRPTLVIDPSPWWQQHRWLLVSLAAIAALGAAIWWAVAAAIERDAALASRAVRPAPVLVDRLMPAAPAGAVESDDPLPAPLPTAPAPVSTMVAPGVHVTPMSVPPGTGPMPAGPRAHDSEPEN